MTGFTNLIYFKDKPTLQDIGKIKLLLESYGEIRWDDKYLFLCGFTIKDQSDTPLFGVRIYSSDTEKEEFDEESKNEFIYSLGYIPKFYIGLMGFTHIKSTEEFIVNLALKITEIKDGIIDFSSAIDPNLARDKEKIRAFVHSIKGDIKELYYTDVNNNRWFTHIVDREFLSNWLNHDKFYIPV